MPLTSLFVLVVGILTLPAVAGAQLAGAQNAAALEALRVRAQERMRKDRSAFSEEQFREIEKLYQTANRNLGAPEAKEILRELIRKYPASNRAGCAVLYLAQMARGDEAEQYLRQAIASHGDAWYGDGAQVGALARFHLARLYAESGRRGEANRIVEEIRTHHPDAVNHAGARLVDVLAAPAQPAAPSGAPPQMEPTVTLSPELARVLSDYESAWGSRNPAALAKLFADDGYVLPNGQPPVKGRAAIEKHYTGSGGPLALRAIAFAIEGKVGYIIGGYASAKGEPDIGKFTLTLRKDADGRWLIASDMDSPNRRPQRPAASPP